ncbi:hypothetical protein Daus18300_002983 [Diaporthe australafricana]|uniref:WSC domain-containing protein n=1 Tax=Diaporthe australafricana TaxID=127596 RepID=A0ABR3XIK6_9PEZI
MSPTRGSTGIGLLAILLIVTIVGLANLDKNDKPSNNYDEAHIPRQGSIRNSRPGPRGLQDVAREGRHPGHGTGTRSASISATRTSYPQPTPTCYMPGPLVPYYDVDADALCQCESYMWDDGSATSNAGWYGGTAICGATCVPQFANQTRLVNEKSGSFSECMLACMGSFDKTRVKNKRQSEEYWFCHGVNFKKGELCQFIGAILYPAFTGDPSDGQCWDNGLTPRG